MSQICKFCMFFWFLNHICTQKEKRKRKRKKGKKKRGCDVFLKLACVVETIFTKSSKFRLSNHRLPIQQRRSSGIPRDERICTVCDSGEVGDEFHYLLNCSNENVRRNRTSMLINIMHIIPTCSNFVVSWIWLQNLRISSLLNLLVVFLSYFD